MCRFFKTNKNTFSIDFANIIYFFILQISFTFFTRYRLNIFLFFQKKIFSSFSESITKISATLTEEASRRKFRNKKQ